MGPLLAIWRTPLLVGSSSVSAGTMAPPTFHWMMNLPPEAFSIALAILSPVCQVMVVAGLSSWAIHLITCAG